MIECPICHNKFNSLCTHIFYKHNMTVKEFKEKFPNQIIQEGIDHSNEEHHCPYCDKKFNSRNGLGTHISYKHNNLIRGSRKDNPKRLNKEGIKCEICGNIYVNIKQHIELKHLINWNDYCEKYNYNGLEKYCSDKTKKLLSINKKNFYDSERGSKLKEIQSQNMLGDKNFSKKSSIRSKISKSRLKTKMTFVGYGIFFEFNLENKHYIARSFNEFKVLISLLENKIPFEYEKVNIAYKDSEDVLRYYITDFVINKNIYELKPYSEIRIKNGEFSTFDKYNHIKEYAEKVGYKFNIVNNRMFETMMKLEHKPNSYYHNIIKNMVEDGSMIKIVVNRSNKSNFLTFIEKMFIPDDKKIIIRRY